MADLAPDSFGRYIEPFAGSAALFFYLRPTAGILGDVNAELVAFYRELASDPRGLFRVVARFAADGSDYYWIRDLVPAELTTQQAAARFLYLNRFCFNGVYRTNRAGRFNVPRGTNTGRLPTLVELETAAHVLRRASIVSRDFADTLGRAKRGDFAYIDPPYFTRNGIKAGEYGCDSLDGVSDLARLSACLNDLARAGVKYLLSYSESRTLLRLIDPVWIKRINVRRSVGGHHTTRKLSREVLIANYIPDHTG